MKRDVRHICLVEDDPDDHYLFSKVLNEIDNTVKLTWFQTSEDLLHFLRSENDLPSLIVLDMNMPKMSGQSCLVSIKNDLNLQQIPVIMFSTAGQSASMNTAYKEGAYKYILKPFSLDEFREIIKEILAIPLT